MTFVTRLVWHSINPRRRRDEQPRPPVRKVCDRQGMTLTERPGTPRTIEGATVNGPKGVLSSDLIDVAHSLHDQYDHGLGEAAVTREIHQVADRFSTATVRSFVPLFVRRYAGENLRARGKNQAGHREPASQAVAAARA